MDAFVGFTETAPSLAVVLVSFLWMHGLVFGYSPNAIQRFILSACGERASIPNPAPCNELPAGEGDGVTSILSSAEYEDTWNFNRSMPMNDAWPKSHFNTDKFF
jgi:hypothetical protein